VYVVSKCVVASNKLMVGPWVGLCITSIGAEIGLNQGSKASKQEGKWKGVAVRTMGTATLNISNSLTTVDN